MCVRIWYFKYLMCTMSTAMCTISRPSILCTNISVWNKMDRRTDRQTDREGDRREHAPSQTADLKMSAYTISSVSAH